MLNSEIRTKPGGWTRVSFVDAVGIPCFVQASGDYAAGPALVIGRRCSEGYYVETALDQRNVRELLPLLQQFIDTGDVV